jgi:hypothetical protein
VLRVAIYLVVEKWQAIKYAEILNENKAENIWGGGEDTLQIHSIPINVTDNHQQSAQNII